MQITSLLILALGIVSGVRDEGFAAESEETSTDIYENNILESTDNWEFLGGYDEEGFSLPFPKLIQRAENLPSNFDSRTTWPKCKSIGHIPDQSGCNDCFAIAAAAMITDRRCIHFYDPDPKKIELENMAASPIDLTTCCRSCYKEEGCKGGSVRKALLFYVNEGIVSEYCRPYPFERCNHVPSMTKSKYPKCKREQTPPCVTRCNDKRVSYFQNKTHGQNPFEINDDMEQTMLQIFTKGPVVAKIELYDDFVKYNSGIYKHTTGKKYGFHAVKLLGWGVENGEEYWLGINSFNEEWGIEGSFKIARGVNMVGVEERIFGIDSF